MSRLFRLLTSQITSAYPISIYFLIALSCAELLPKTLPYWSHQSHSIFDGRTDFACSAHYINCDIGDGRRGWPR
jgi:hypothetical protein